MGPKRMKPRHSVSSAHTVQQFSTGTAMEVPIPAPLSSVCSRGASKAAPQLEGSKGGGMVGGGGGGGGVGVVHELVGQQLLHTACCAWVPPQQPQYWLKYMVFSFVSYQL